MIPTLPLQARNRLAETILAALHDARAREELAALAGASEGALAERARRACQALAERPLGRPGGPLAEALAEAAALHDAGLFFEVHELLEPYWSRANGEARETLQGLIQVAVGYQHLANGNARGARALLEEGSGRLHGRTLAELALDGFARAVMETLDRLGDFDWKCVPRFPRARKD